MLKKTKRNLMSVGFPFPYRWTLFSSPSSHQSGSPKLPTPSRSSLPSTAFLFHSLSTHPDYHTSRTEREIFSVIQISGIGNCPQGSPEGCTNLPKLFMPVTEPSHRRC